VPWEFPLPVQNP